MVTFQIIILGVFVSFSGFCMGVTMNIDDFRYIVTITDLGGFTKAAKKLYIAQPSLSQRVKHIEEEYDICIFIRDSRKGVYLTPEGEVFVKHARRILSTYDNLLKELSDMKNNAASVIKIGAAQIINSSFFDHIILNYNKLHPEVYFKIEQEKSSLDTQKLLSVGQLDLAISYLPIAFDNLQYQVIIDDRMVLVPARGSILEKRIRDAGINPEGTVDPHLLDNVPFASIDEDMQIGNFILSLPEKYNVRPDIKHYSRNYHSLYTIAKEGIASTILMRSFFTKGEHEGPYYYIDADETISSIAIVWRRNSYLSATTRALIKVSQELASEYDYES